MTVPTIHRNGSSAESLIAGYSDTRYKIEQAVEALLGQCPNGRDYYLQANGAMRSAEDEHRSRVARLRSVSAELESLVMAIQEQES